jgi:hypothetical protein
VHPDGVRLFVSTTTGISVVDTSSNAEIQFQPMGTTTGRRGHARRHARLPRRRLGTVCARRQHLGLVTTIPVGGQPFAFGRSSARSPCGDGT